LGGFGDQIFATQKSRPKNKNPRKALNLGWNFNYKNFPGKFIYFDFDLFMMIKKNKNIKK
jgi:hypothetical protein